MLQNESSSISFRGNDIEPPQPEYVCGRSVEAD